MGFVPSHPQYDGVYLSKKEHARLLALANRYSKFPASLGLFTVHACVLTRFEQLTYAPNW